jgi:hypothetical protein
MQSTPLIDRSFIARLFLSRVPACLSPPQVTIDIAASIGTSINPAGQKVIPQTVFDLGFAPSAE